MSKKYIQEIAEVTRKSGAFGDRYVVEVDGHSKKFKSEEEAVAYRTEQLARQEEQKRIQKWQQEEERLRAEYDADPEYLTMKIAPPLAIAPEPGGWFKRQVTESMVDVDAYARELNDLCYELAGRGYEIVSLTPLTSGYGGYLLSPKHQGGAGWGVSWTEGVLVLARKVRKAPA